MENQVNNNSNSNDDEWRQRDIPTTNGISNEYELTNIEG